MTTDVARLLEIETWCGAIKPVLIAYIVATLENPLDYIQTLRKVAFAMKNDKFSRKSINKT